MATTAVDIVVKTIGTSSLEKLDRKLKGIPAQANKAAAGIGRVSKAVRGLGGAIASLGAADQLRRAFGAAADFSGTQQRVQNLTKTYSQFVGIQDLAAQSASKFAVSNAQALSDLTDLGSRLGSTGTSLQDIQNIYEGFNTLLVNNAVNAQQAASAQLQLNQALGSGRLAGEEFNAINEATPQLLDEVANVLKVSRGELKKLASDGKITSETLITALTNIKEKGGDALADSLKTPAGQLRQFNAAIKDFQVAVGAELLPVITPLVQGLTQLLQQFGQLPGPVRAAAVSIALVTTAVIALQSALALLGGIGIGALFGKIATSAGAAATALNLIGAKAQAAAAGKTALATAMTAANTKIAASTVALGAFKVALLAIPWVAAAAGVAAIGAAIVNYNVKQREMNRLLTDTSVKAKELEAAVASKAAELARASAELDRLTDSGIKNARAINVQEDRVRRLRAQLEALEGVYKAQVQVEIAISGFRSDGCWV